MSKVVFVALIAFVLYVIYNIAFVSATTFATKTKLQHSNITLQLQEDGDLGDLPANTGGW